MCVMGGVWIVDANETFDGRDSGKECDVNLGKAPRGKDDDVRGEASEDVSETGDGGEGVFCEDGLPCENA